MREASKLLDRLAVPHECKVVSAHRTPGLMAEYAKSAAERGLKAIIAGAGGAAHLPGMIAAQTLLPVLGVPIQSRALGGIDSLLSIVQMPAGIPVATFAIGIAGAKNAALFAAALLAGDHPAIGEALGDFRRQQTQDASIANWTIEDSGRHGPGRPSGSRQAPGCRRACGAAHGDRVWAGRRRPRSPGLRKNFRSEGTSAQ